MKEEEDLMMKEEKTLEEIEIKLFKESMVLWKIEEVEVLIVKEMKDLIVE